MAKVKKRKAVKIFLYEVRNRRFDCRTLFLYQMPSDFSNHEQCIQRIDKGNSGSYAFIHVYASASNLLSRECFLLQVNYTVVLKYCNHGHRKGGFGPP